MRAKLYIMVKSSSCLQGQILTDKIKFQSQLVGIYSSNKVLPFEQNWF